MFLEALLVPLLCLIQSDGPVLTFRAPYKTRLFRLPMMGTSTGLPLGAHRARRGGVSVMMVASVNSTTVRFLPFSPRLSPLLLAARRGPGGPGDTWVVSTGSPSPSDTGVPWCRLLQYPRWLVDGSAAERRSSPRPGSHTRWGGYPAPASPVPPLLAASFWDSRSGAGQTVFPPPIWNLPAATSGPRSRQLRRSPPTVAQQLWGALPDLAIGDPEPSEPAGHQ